MYRSISIFFPNCSWNMFFQHWMYQQSRKSRWELRFRIRSLLCIHVRFSKSIFTLRSNLHTFHYRITTCGATVPNNCSYIQNPNYPSSESSGDCSFNISPLNADVCQLRLDFDNFDITETAPITGACTDTFDVTSGSSRDYFALCGTLTGQHSKFCLLRLYGTFFNTVMFF